MKQSALIWIVDDSPTQAAIAERALGEQHRFEHFPDGYSVIERLNASHHLPDVVLLDWVMPGLSGDEVCRFVRASPRTSELAIVIMTASRIDTDDVVCALESGANDYISKPFAAQELRARVGSILRAVELRHVAELERRRITTINQLGRALFKVGTEVAAILNELATALVGTLCDGCVISVASGGPTPTADSAVRHRSERGAAMLASLAAPEPVVHAFETAEQALATLPPAWSDYVAAFGLRGAVAIAVPMRGLADGLVTLTRDGTSEPFDANDLAAITTCLELTGLAIESAIRTVAERAAMRFHEEMIGIVSHDLRTPLGAVSLGIQLLLDRSDADPISTRVIGRIQNSANRMTSIVDQLLDVTRARIGQGIQLSPRATQLKTLVADVLDEVRLIHRATSFDAAGDDVDGSWDPDRLAQVISNLVSNAAQYGRPGAPVEVAWSRSADTAIITVRNEIRSAPIPPAQLRALFDPFTRGDTRDHARGLGLGLYIVSEIVRAHRGVIAVESSLDGTVFRIELPIGVRDQRAERFAQVAALSD
jgi:signal transduction histidine kinase